MQESPKKPQATKYRGWELEEAHYMCRNEDCMGNPTPDYWRAWGVHRAAGYKFTQIGFGKTKKEAEEDCLNKVLAQERAWNGEM